MCFKKERYELSKTYMSKIFFEIYRQKLVNYTPDSQICGK